MNPNTPEPNNQPDVPVPEPVVTPVESVPVAPVPEPTAPAPADPIMPVGSAPSPAPQDKKKLFTIIGIIAGVVILAVIAVLVYLSMTSVSKQDYAAAADQYNEVRSSSAALSREVSGLSRSATASDATFDEAAKTVEEALATIKNENEELGKLKAVKVGEGKKLYDTFDQKLDAYLAYAQELLATVKDVRPALVKCDEVGDTTAADARVAALKACSEAFNQVGDLPNAEFKAYANVLKTEYANYATTYEKMNALSNPFGANYDEYRDLRDQMTESQSKIRDANKTFSDAVRARDDELSVKDSADTLAKYLNDQQRN